MSDRQVVQSRRGKMPTPDAEVVESRLNLRVSPELRRAVHHAAIDADMTVGAWVEMVIRERLANARADR